MIPSGYNAWKHDETIRQWFEVVFDTFTNPMKHTGYVCKCCWEQFEANTNTITLLAHAGWHQSRGESLYPTDRPSAITGEEVWDLFHALSEHFQRVMPQAGTWKFQCRKCLKLLPHRTPHHELMSHARICSDAKSPGGNHAIN